MKFMKIAREWGHEATLTYNNKKINERMCMLEQLGEEEQARKEVCEQPNVTSNPKRTASDRMKRKCGDRCRQNNDLHKEILGARDSIHAEVSQKRSLTILRKATRRIFLGTVGWRSL